MQNGTASELNFPSCISSHVCFVRALTQLFHPFLNYQARRAQRDSDDSEEEAEEEEEEEDIEALLDAEEEEEEEIEEEEEESEEDAIERLKTEIGDRYDEETGKVAIVQVSEH